MEKMEDKNIILFFERIIEDDRIHPAHISMYVSLFQFWTWNRFDNPISISRKKIMKESKISSIATYHKCIKELNQYGYIMYEPSYNSCKGSSVTMVDPDHFDSRQEIVETKVYKENIFLIPQVSEVTLYFLERDLKVEEAEAFYTHYQSQDWKLDHHFGKMRSWRAAARCWIMKLKDEDQQIVLVKVTPKNNLL